MRGFSINPQWKKKVSNNSVSVVCVINNVDVVEVVQFIFAFRYPGVMPSRDSDTQNIFTEKSPYALV